MANKNGDDLFTEDQCVAVAYRIRSVLVTSREKYLENRKLLWGTTLSIRLRHKKSNAHPRVNWARAILHL